MRSGFQREVLDKGGWIPDMPRLITSGKKRYSIIINEGASFLLHVITGQIR